MQTEIIKFRPSNGTEGELFITGWCGNCARDKSCSEGINIDDCAEEELCEIIGKTMRFSLDDPEYPEEWQFKGGFPVCTAFISAGEKIPCPRCSRTIDMFEENHV